MSYSTVEQPQTLGGHLKRWRQRAGFKQEEVAQRLGIDQTAVSAMERGTQRIPHDRLTSLIALYKVPAVEAGAALGGATDALGVSGSAA